MVVKEVLVVVDTIPMASSGGLIMPASLIVVREDSPVKTEKLVGNFPPDASGVGIFLLELLLTVIPSEDSSVATVMKLVDVSPLDTLGIAGLSVVRSSTLLPENSFIPIVKLMVDISAHDASALGGFLVVPSLTVVCEDFSVTAMKLMNTFPPAISLAVKFLAVMFLMVEAIASPVTIGKLVNPSALADSAIGGLICMALLFFCFLKCRLRWM